MYVNTQATQFEDVWLDEGLAHVAEELLFYARAPLGPRQDLDVTALRSSSGYVTAFNEDAISNFERLQSFLASPSVNSPYADNDSLATRGATWSFLRYATDHQTAAEETIWFALVNSVTTGFATLQGAFGSDLTPLFRDWATAF